MQTGTEYRIFGPPGTGKTTTVSRLVTEACQEYGSENVLAASFTRTAARELVRRDLPMNEEQIGTLHALCYRMLDRPEIVGKTHLKDWNAQHPSWSFEGGAVSDLDDPYAGSDAGGAQEGDKIVQDYHRLRGLMIPQEEWPVRVQWFADAWQDFKEQTHTLDFTDLIATCLTERANIPNGAKVFFLDEVQDFSPLELALARHWGSQAEKTYLAGDDDQCHGGDTLIRTVTRGDVKIADLREDDKLRTYDRKAGAELYGTKRKGFPFERACRPYKGDLHTFRLEDGTEISATHNHRMMARWTARAVNAPCVYLMRRGLRWRVGMTQVIRGYSGTFGPSGRARSEFADEIWILKICESRSSAALEEDYIAAKYGVSKLVFEWQPSILHTQAALDGHHDRMIEVGDITGLLRDYGKYLDYPYWSLADRYKGRGCKAWQLIRAANCFPEYMEMLTDVGRAKGAPVVIARKTVTAVEMPVYSLNVEPYHTYVANGVVTPNCLYRFKGAVPDTFLSPELPAEQVQVLAQSYRIPRAVHAAAVRWIEGVEKRMPKAYQPRQADGLVETLPITYKYLAPIKDQLDGWLAEGKRVAFLASCSFFVDPVKHQLREWGVPFWNPYRKQRGDWNPLQSRAGTVSAADRLLAFRKVADAGQWWTYRDLWTWAATLEADEVFARGAKTAMRRKAEDEAVAVLPVEASDLDTWMPGDEAADAATTGDVSWLQSKMLATYQKPMAYASAVLQARGSAALTGRPLVSIGTIHSYKGGEADVVVLFPDLSPAGYREWTMPGDAQDSVRRMIYVGMTRAREALYWAQPCGLSIGGYL